MDFKKYRESIIEDFEEDCQLCGLDRCLTEEEKDIIRERFEDHVNCFDDGYEDARSQAIELIVSCIYGDNESASIECMECNTVLIDDNALLEQ